MNNKSEKRLTIGIPHKDRLVEICQLLQSVMIQNFTDYDILIVDDSLTDCLSNSTFQGHCNVLRELGHDVRIIKGKTLGPQFSGQIICDNATTPYVFRPDDDIVLSSPNFLDELMNVIESDENIAAVGPIYISPNKKFNEQMIDPNMSKEFKDEMGRVFWDQNGNLFLTGWLQSIFHIDPTPIQTQHLNSGFLYRRDVVSRIKYRLDLSPSGHREESFMSYGMFIEGYKLFIVPSAVAYHYHPMSGGIRESQGVWHSKSNWDADEQKFLEWMEQVLPKPQKIQEDRFVSVLILSSGDHNNLDLLLESIIKYTNHHAEYIISNNDISDLSKNRFQEISNKYSDRKDFKFYQYSREFSVSEARNQLAKLSSHESKFICFIDDDARILGRYNQTTDWLDYLWNRFHEVEQKYPCGAISPIYTWLEELQCHCVSVACMFTSKKVWNKVGGFDPVFGNKEKGTWAWEDSDFSYRLESAGYKLAGVVGHEFPFFHENTTGKKKTPEREIAILKGYSVLLDKYKVIKNNDGTFSGPIHEICRKGYPFTYEQMSTQGTKLNLGCNYMKLDDFINIDINPDVKPDMVLDITKLHEKFPANSVNLILISQTLEHVDEQIGMEVLNQIHYVLSPGSWIIVEVPDGGDIEEKFKNGEINEHQYNTLKSGNTEVPYQDHHALYTKEKLENILRNIGFREIVHFPIDMTSDKWESIRIDARK